MIKEAFLACALALPVAFIHHASGWSEKDANIKREHIKKFKKRLYEDMPGYEIAIVEKGPPAQGDGPPWEKIEIVYEDHYLYRRKVGNSGGHDSPESREAFLEIYRHVHDFLKKQYPSHEFLIISHDFAYVPPPGWTRIVHIVWDSYFIYKRPRRGFPAERNSA